MYGFAQGSWCLLLYFLICVAVAFPSSGSAAAAYFDRIGSVVVSCYLLQCARTVKENRQR